MNVTITSVFNPFSFFCLGERQQCSKDELHKLDSTYQPGTHSIFKNEFLNVVHGQYVAVMWKQKWVRGIVSMESQFLIWLVDYGIYIRSQDAVCVVNLPPEFKNLASKVFEASIHGVVPVDKAINFEGAMKSKITSSWTEGAIAHAQKLINSATRTYFVPVALLSTKINDIVLGDLYLDLPETGMTNFIDEMAMWPVFLQKNKEAYINSLEQFYTNRRRHRASLLKPNIPDLQTISLQITLEEYSAICKDIPNECLPSSNIGGSAKSNEEKNNNKYNNIGERPSLTEEEMDQYANTRITVCGREYNLIQTVVTKYKEIQQCQRYQDHDLKSIGRGFRRFP